MSKLTAQDFSGFFEALWGFAPFAWQKTLAERVLNESKMWPEAIALPTAAGKTACLDIAVYTLAAQAERLAPGKPLNVPRRIFFVVDRRIIVDEAFERGRTLAKKLGEAEDGILKTVADRLCGLAGGDNPLACYQLRGGMYRDDVWAKSPIQPTIVTSTVDQMGSRLLFRAYGRSFKAWPIQAGLAGNDSLIILDEAHCAQPFLETLQAVNRYRTWADEPLGAPFQVTVMSATPPSGLLDVFRDESTEPATPGHPLGDRQLATKPTRLQVADKAKGAKVTEELANALVKEAENLADGRAVATVIFVNRVATARRVHAILAAKHGDHAVLLTGRMRPIDRDDTVAVWLNRLSADISRDRQLERPVFVVATQTLEVGANLDFDVLVTECASLDALRQRFGRLNRMGRPGAAPATVLVRSDQITLSDDDPVYGPALAHTWQWLNEQSGETGQVDMGIAALGKHLLSDEVLAALNAPAPHAPVMFPAHMDSWAQTAPEPLPSPDVGLFLHGPRRATADVHVCWRADLDLEADGERWLDALALCPPTAAECLSVPIGTMRRWLAGEDEGAIFGADVEGVEESDSPAKLEVDTDPRRVVRWLGREEAETISDPKALRPGDVVVIPAALGGFDALGDVPRPAGQIFADWGERAHRLARAKAMLRLHPKVIDGWQAGQAGQRLIELAKQGQARLDEDPVGLVTELREALTALGEVTAYSWLAEIARHLAQDKHLKRAIALHPVAGLVVRGSHFSDEDDASASGTVRALLDDHLTGVEAYAKRFAEGCGLPAHIVEDIVLAGRAHDLGKADPRFQTLLYGGNPWARGVLLAKSSDLPTGRAAFEHARRSVGYPKGGRHELLSVRFLESLSELWPEGSAEEVRRERVLHLVGNHHGYCRPFAPVVEDFSPRVVTVQFVGRTLSATSDTLLDRLDSGVAERFWHLTRRHGWWGLAWLEAILRLADHRRSEAEQSGAAYGGDEE